MPEIEFAKQPPTRVPAQAVAVFAGARDGTLVLGTDAAAAGRALDVDLSAELDGLRFDGSLGAVARVPTRGRATAPMLLVAGVGDPQRADLDALRRAAGSVARQAAKDATLALCVPADLLAGDADVATRAAAVAEGAGLGAYAFRAYRTKTDDLPSLERIVLVAGEGADGRAVRRGLEAGETLVRATTLARDLVNEPPAGKRPPALADRIAEIARVAGLKRRVLDERALAEGGFGGILGVGQGSSEPPRLVELTHDPLRSKGHVVLVGKGITFDSGGLSLKPPGSMTTMKSDMSGAAAVVAAMSVLKQLHVRTKVTGLVALAENMPSGDAIRVSDVLTHRGGTTVEVLNTDAEGRLVLADGLALAAEEQPDAIVDLATLTGACIVALGAKITGLMGNDDDLMAEVRSAAERAGEPAWPLPLPKEYRKQLDSEIADLKNIGGRSAGALTAGLFLKEFVGDIPWVHLDIAGPSRSDEEDGPVVKGATGVGVRTLLELLGG
ncbi:leucyl aminopeptidase [soil metagenome]